MGVDLTGYVDVSTRLRLALAKYPDLRIIEDTPELVADGQFVSVTVSVYRSPDDTMPTRGTAWEPIPGKTPYTRDSEMMNAATSALGRALGYMGFGIVASLASSDEVLNRVTDRAHAPQSREAGERERPPYVERDPAGAIPRPASNGNPKMASDPQKKLIRRLLVEKDYTLEDTVNIDDLTMGAAIELIDLLKTLPEVAR